MRHLAVSVVLAGVLAFASAASAGKPLATRVEVDDFIPGAVNCGTYSLDVHVVGRIIFRSFFDKNDTLHMTLNNFALKVTYSNPTTGESLTSPNVGPDHLTIEKDGSATLAVVGLVAHVIVPGQGLVAGEIGRVSLFFTDPADTEPDVSLAGIHDGGVEEEVDALFCSPLAP